MKKDRYVKLNSVGCWFDLKTGYTFPMSVLNGAESDKKMYSGMVVHVKDCSYEWIDSLKGTDKVYVGVWFKNNG